MATFKYIVFSFSKIKAYAAVVQGYFVLQEHKY